ncbi:MAG: 50S ribosomal protein L23 [Anaerolineaceae bacterium]|nr:50S ribosomal protein L23 [Anaerolineaceae bacterium]
MEKTAFDIIRRPVVTEKSNYQSSVLHQYVFEVASDATRSMVKKAIETVFDVKVVRVNILNLPGKSKRNSRSRRLAVRNNGYKKAVVTLVEGDRIPIFEGVE